MLQDLEKVYKTMEPNDEIVTGFGNPLGYLKIEPHDSLIDLGCGGGQNCNRVAEMTDGLIVGVDAQKKMIDFAEKENTKGIRYILGDFMKNDFADNSFDKVISNCAFAHAEDKVSLIEEVYRLLKKGGQFCFCDLTIKRKIPSEVFYAIDSNEWIDILKNSSFYKTGGFYFVEEKAYFYQGRWMNIYYSTFLVNK